MKTTTPRISQAIDALKNSLDDTQESLGRQALTPQESLAQLAREIKELQAQKAALLEEIQALEAHKFELSGPVKKASIQKSARKRAPNSQSKPVDKTPAVDPQEAMNKLAAAFEGF